MDRSRRSNLAAGIVLSGAIVLSLGIVNSSAADLSTGAFFVKASLDEGAIHSTAGLNGRVDGDSTPAVAPVFSPRAVNFVPRGSHGGTIVADNGFVYLYGQTGTSSYMNGTLASSPVPVNDGVTAPAYMWDKGGSNGGIAYVDNRFVEWGLAYRTGVSPAAVRKNAEPIPNVQGTGIQEVVQRGNPTYYYGFFLQNTSGEVYSWGNNINGELGTGHPTGTKGVAPTKLNFGGEKVRKIIGDQIYGAAATESGKLYGWGAYSGTGPSTTVLVPTQVTALSSEKVIDLQSAAVGALALTESGKVYAWGDGANGRLGTGNTGTNSTPQLVLGLGSEKVTKIWSTRNGGYALTATGQVYSWGLGTSGANGNGQTTNANTAVKVLGLDGETVVSLDPKVGINHFGAYVLTQSGKIFHWGRGAMWPGDTQANALTATQLNGFGAAKIVAIDTRFATTTPNGGYALTEAGEVYAWGQGTAGGNGNGSTAHSATPVLVQGLQGRSITRIFSNNGEGSSSGSGGVAIDATGKIYQWGYGAWGNGSGDTSASLTAREMVLTHKGKTVPFAATEPIA